MISRCCLSTFARESGRSARIEAREDVGAFSICRAVALVFLCAFCACAPFARGSHSGARIRLQTEVWNFGTIARGDTAKTEIGVSNVGTDSLRLAVNTACGCLSAAASPAIVPPQGSGKILLAFAGETVTEAASKTLFVDSNDPARPRVTITARGAVAEGTGPHLVAIPDPLGFLRAPAQVETAAPGQVRFTPADLTLSNSGHRDLLVSAVRCFGCSTGWNELALAPGESAVLEIAILPDWKGSRWIEIASDDPVTPLKRINLVELD